VGLFQNEASEIKPLKSTAINVIPKHLLPVPHNITKVESRGLSRTVCESRDYPDTAIGVVSVRLEDGTRVFGMGTIISENTVITCAQLLLTRLGVEAVEVHFISSIFGGDGRVFKAKSWKVLEEYRNSGEPEKWDLGVITLQENNIMSICGRLARRGRYYSVSHLAGA
jgi:hypothetical protein